jgi:hypothetical protein
LLSCNFQDKIVVEEEIVSKNITYYSTRIVIFWCPTEKELETNATQYSEEENSIMDDDADYYNTMAVDYILEKKEQLQTSTNNLIGFIINNDTLVLTKPDSLLWSVILFDGKSIPKIVAPLDIYSGECEDFFNKK